MQFWERHLNHHLVSHKASEDCPDHRGQKNVLELYKDYEAATDHNMQKMAYHVDGVRGVHDLRTRQSGNTEFIQLHLELDDDQSLYEAHYKADILEAELDKLFPQSDILIHLDPLSIVALEKKNNKLQFESKPVEDIL